MAILFSILLIGHDSTEPCGSVFLFGAGCKLAVESVPPIEARYSYRRRGQGREEASPESGFGDGKRGKFGRAGMGRGYPSGMSPLQSLVPLSAGASPLALLPPPLAAPRPISPFPDAHYAVTTSPGLGLLAISPQRVRCPSECSLPQP